MAVFGDAALTNGIPYEALNNITTTTDRFIGILNDNEWSIDKNVGAVSSYLNKIITNPRYKQAHGNLESLMKRLPKGDLAVRLGLRAEEAIKGAVSDVSLKQRQSTDDRYGKGGQAHSIIFELSLIHI